MAELHGGEIWTQPDFPNFSCYLVFIGGDQWCRIPPPDQRGSIAMTTKDSGPIHSHDELLGILLREHYVFVGQFSERQSR